MITSLGLACGVVGVVFALEGRIWLAFPLMLAASVFDFCDGLAARALDAYSDLGKELDSLSDMVSFGVLPAVMLYNLMKTCTFSSSAWCLVPLLLAVFSGLRLAKFNVDPRQHRSFVGLPTPVAALLCGSLCSLRARLAARDPFRRPGVHSRSRRGPLRPAGVRSAHVLDEGGCGRHQNHPPQENIFHSGNSRDCGCRAATRP